MFSLFMVIYLISVMPFKHYALNLLEIFNECCILAVGYTLIPLSDAVDDYLVKWNFGWVLLAIIVLNIIVNILFLIKGMKDAAFDFCKRRRDRILRKK